MNKMTDLIHNRRSPRLPHYNYGQSGAYFVTVCVKGRERVLGEVVGEDMQLSMAGKIVKEVWDKIPEHYAHVEIGEFMVMPNHVHGIVWITEEEERTNIGAENNVRAQHAAAPLPKQNHPHVKPGSLGAIVRSFKSAATRKINLQRGTIVSPFWQRGYHEHIIRDDEDLLTHREYILNNPLKWALDEYYLEMEASKT